MDEIISEEVAETAAEVVVKEFDFKKAGKIGAVAAGVVVVIFAGKKLVKDVIVPAGKKVIGKFKKDQVDKNYVEVEVIE